MSGNQKFAAASVRPHVERFMAELAPACKRIAVAGSLRRLRPEVGDVELVAISKPYTPGFGEPVYPDRLTARLAELEREGQITRYAYADRPTALGKWGDRYKELRLMVGSQAVHWKIDLFVTTVEQWGAIYTIRTGPAEFSQAFVTVLKQAGYRQVDGWLTREGERIPTPEEADYFAVLGFDVIPPAQRTAARLWKEFRSALAEGRVGDISRAEDVQDVQLRMF